MREWAKPRVWERFAEICSFCYRRMNVFSDEDSIDCVGHCWGCIRAIEEET